MILQKTIEEVLSDQSPPPALKPEVRRTVLADLGRMGRNAVVLKGVRRCGKSILQAQLMREQPHRVYCNLEDTRLYGMNAGDFPALLAALERAASGTATVFLDEVQAVDGWEKLVRALLDRGHKVCVTGSNASLLGRDVGIKLTGRHSSHEVFPFDYGEYLAFTSGEPGVDTLQAYLDQGGFPLYLGERQSDWLRDLLRDIIERDIAQRHGLRETRHLMNLALFLLAHTGQPFSLQTLTKTVAIPSVSQTTRYIDYLADAYLLLPIDKFHHSFKKRIVTPKKYYAVDNGLRQANTPQSAPDLGRRLENEVFLALRRCGLQPGYDGEKDGWECDFVTRDTAIQVCARLTPENSERETGGLLRAIAGNRKRLRALILTLDQRENRVIDGVSVDIFPAWEWLCERG